MNNTNTDTKNTNRNTNTNKLLLVDAINFNRKRILNEYGVFLETFRKYEDEIDIALYDQLDRQARNEIDYYNSASLDDIAVAFSGKPYTNWRLKMDMHAVDYRGCLAYESIKRLIAKLLDSIEEEDLEEMDNNE